MARRVIVLDQVTEPDGGLHFRVVYWPDVPALRQSHYANAGFVSAVTDGSVTAGELAALRSGAVTEVPSDARWAPGTTLAQAEADLQAKFATVQAAVTAANPWQRYGSAWDDVTGWTVKNNG